MTEWKSLGSNIIKLDGYGVYVTYMDSNVYICDITMPSGHPKLDPDSCIEWTELEDPPNQKFLNLINARFSVSLTMTDYGKTMKISEIKEHSEIQKALSKEEKPMSDAQARWFVKNMRELYK